MAYFPLTGKLLSEPTFLTFISRVNEDYVSLDANEYDEYQAKGKGFALNGKTWATKCKDAKTQRPENDTMLTFRQFALNRVNALINFDIDLYVKEYRSGKKEGSLAFLEELEKIREHISQANYLEPISSELLETLNKVPKDILTQEKPGDVVVVREGQDYLTWNGPVADLFAMFRDLANTKSPISAKMILDYSTADLGAFIIRHFRDSNGNPIPEMSIETYLNQPEATKGAKTKKTTAAK